MKFFPLIISLCFCVLSLSLGFLKFHSSDPPGLHMANQGLIDLVGELRDSRSILYPKPGESSGYLVYVNRKGQLKLVFSEPSKNLVFASTLKQQILASPDHFNTSTGPIENSGVSACKDFQVQTQQDGKAVMLKLSIPSIDEEIFANTPFQAFHLKIDLTHPDHGVLEDL